MLAPRIRTALLAALSPLPLACSGRTPDAAAAFPEPAQRLRRVGRESLTERPIPATQPAEPSEREREALRALGSIA